MALQRLTDADRIHALTDGKPARLRDDDFSQEEYYKVRTSLTLYRDILLTKLFRATGLRISEVLGSGDARTKNKLAALTPLNLNTDTLPPYFLIRRAKRKFGAEIEYEPFFIPAELGIEIRDFIRGHSIKPKQPIFGITPRRYQQIIHEAGMRALDKSVHPHQIRKLFSTILLDGGVPLSAVADLMGHIDERTTRRHYYALTNDKRAALAQRMGEYV